MDINYCDSPEYSGIVNHDAGPLYEWLFGVASRLTTSCPFSLEELMAKSLNPLFMCYLLDIMMMPSNTRENSIIKFVKQ